MPRLDFVTQEQAKLYAELLPLALAVMEEKPEALAELRRLAIEDLPRYKRLAVMLTGYWYGKPAAKRENDS